MAYEEFIESNFSASDLADIAIRLLAITDGLGEFPIRVPHNGPTYCFYRDRNGRWSVTSGPRPIPLPEEKLRAWIAADS